MSYIIEILHHHKAIHETTEIHPNTAVHCNLKLEAKHVYSSYATT